MGNFYMNVTLIGAERDAILVAVDNLQRVAYVTPSRDRITVVFDRETEVKADPAALGDLALTLSRDLACPALAAAVYDDDVLLLGLYDRGEQLGEYNSARPSSLHASTLAQACGASSRTPIVWAAMRSPHLPVFLFESFRHSVLLKLLRMPPWAYATGYKYIHQGEPPPQLNRAELSHLG